MADDFDAAASWLSSNPSAASLPNDTKLEIYGLFKYVNTGSGPSNSRPSIFYMQARAKHDAWVTQSKKYANDTEDARERYMEIAKELGWEGGDSSSGSAIGGIRVSMMAQEEVPAGASSELHDAVIEGRAEEVERLVKSGMDVDSRDNYGLTPLHLAADRGNIEIVRLLLKLGASRTITDEDDQTPLMLAEASERPDIVDVLRND